MEELNSRCSRCSQQPSHRERAQDRTGRVRGPYPVAQTPVWHSGTERKPVQRQEDELNGQNSPSLSNHHQGHRAQLSTGLWDPRLEAGHLWKCSQGHARWLSATVHIAAARHSTVCPVCFSWSSLDPFTFPTGVAPTPHFTGEQTEAQQRQETCPRTLSQEARSGSSRSNRAIAPVPPLSPLCPTPPQGSHPFPPGPASSLGHHYSSIPQAPSHDGLPADMSPREQE